MRIVIQKCFAATLATVATTGLLFPATAAAGETYSRTATAKLGPKKETSALTIGEARYAYFGNYWFYDKGSRDDPAFGFSDVVVRVTKEGPNVRVRFTYKEDGNQGGSGGSGYNGPLKVVLLSGSYPEAVIDGVPYNIECHSSEIGGYEIVVNSVIFEDLDAVGIPAGSALSVTC